MILVAFFATETTSDAGDAQRDEPGRPGLRHRTSVELIEVLGHMTA